MNNIISKPADTQYSIHPLLAERYSPRTFDHKIPDADILNRIFEAVRWAPSSMNDQPWSLIAGIKGTSTYDKIFESLVEFNQKWAKLAPVLIVIAGNKKSAKTAKENSAYKYDCGQAAAYLTFQAMQEDIYTHQMGGFSKEVLISNFSLDDHTEPLVVIALGYRGSPDNLDENFRKMEYSKRIRKQIADFVSY